MASIRFAQQLQAECGLQSNRSVDICSVLLPLSAMIRPELGDVAGDNSQSTQSNGSSDGAPKVSSGVALDDDVAAFEELCAEVQARGVTLTDESLHLLRALNGDRVIDAANEDVKGTLRSVFPLDMRQFAIRDDMKPSTTTQALSECPLSEWRKKMWKAAIDCVNYEFQEAGNEARATFQPYMPSTVYESPLVLFVNPHAPVVDEPPFAHQFEDMMELTLPRVEEDPLIQLTRLRIADIMEKSLSRKIVVQALRDIAFGNEEKHKEWNRKLGRGRRKVLGGSLQWLKGNSHWKTPS